ncbi:GxxExxY protein [Balneolaceae bacterium YR4-1]|uniref:GxxExxY protein n=1 Tax=Halalkalibaculum roseum TaxID=2709311 RepID=A0A6M1SSV3_9BACT|nr:GxxExxY protein [Halalkalibaculum roseum]NGP75178.1 GxxExxY protein [Halalkalibaculum roseum]
MLHSETTGLVIKSFYNVYNKLGYGFLEKVYEKALMIELQKKGLSCVSQYPIQVNYRGVVVGDYFADIFVANSIIVELKASEQINLEHELQLINYLRATNAEIGLLLNFGRKPEFRRKIFTNNYKSPSISASRN